MCSFLFLALATEGIIDAPIKPFETFEIKERLEFSLDFFGISFLLFLKLIESED
jgi:hypothetical protein